MTLGANPAAQPKYAAKKAILRIAVSAVVTNVIGARLWFQKCCLRSFASFLCCQSLDALLFRANTFEYFLECVDKYLNQESNHHAAEAGPKSTVAFFDSRES